MDHEEGSKVVNDNFYIQGLGIMQAQIAAKEAELLAEEEARDAVKAAGQDVDVEMVDDQEDRDLNLLEGRLRCEELKKGSIAAYKGRLDMCIDMQTSSAYEEDQSIVK